MPRLRLPRFTSTTGHHRQSPYDPRLKRTKLRVGGGVGRWWEVSGIGSQTSDVPSVCGDDQSVPVVQVSS